MDQDRLPDDELDNIKGQLRNMLTDKDRLRIIKAVGRNWYFTAKQAAELLSVAQFSGAGVEAGVLLYAKVVDQDNINGMLAAYRYDEDKQDFLTRVRASADFERREPAAPAKPEPNLSHPIYLEAKAREAAKKATNEEAAASIYQEVNRETRGFASTDDVSRPVETYLERAAETKQAAPERAQVSIALGARTFAVAQLQDPATAASLGIDLTHKESYLTDADFSRVFGMDKTAFQGLPQWKQNKLKKDNNLF